jgi:hypothetical protein
MARTYLVFDDIAVNRRTTLKTERRILCSGFCVTSQDEGRSVC